VEWDTSGIFTESNGTGCPCPVRRDCGYFGTLGGTQSSSAGQDGGVTLREGDVDVRERVLLIESRLSTQAFDAARSGLPESWESSCAPLFVQFSYADLPIGKTFECLYPAGMPSEVRWVDISVVGVTQQWAKPFSEIPHGWKTITLFRFNPSIPAAISSLPECDAWYEAPIELHFASRETWESLVSG
jgi:hypothetical protein